MKIIFKIFLVLMMIPLASMAEPISDAVYLRKLSLHIRGINPSANEYSELKTIDPSLKEQYFARKISEYLKTEFYYKKMSYQVLEMLQIKTPTDAKLQDPNTTGFNYPIQNLPSSTNDLIYQIMAKDLSWDQLITGKSYVMYPQYNTNNKSGDLAFFQLMVPNWKPVNTDLIFAPNQDPLYNSQEVQSIEFAIDDPRIAGVVTTERFMKRYVNTAINKNRKRAAAIFRIFLCDPMFPAIESNKDRKHEFLDSSFATKFFVTEKDIQAQVNDNKRHGNDPDCMACHEKLDPMGQTMLPFGTAMHPYPSPGALFFRRNSKEVVNIPVTGVGDLAKKITQLPEYASCQVNWFWKTFIGTDVRLSNEQQRTLINKFDEVGRQPGEFIRYLVTLPEFKNPPTKSEVIHFSQVQTLLKRCDSCHAKYPEIPVFANLPIGFSNTSSEQSDWLISMKNRMHLEPENKKRMPKDADMNWSTEDISRLKRWLNEGALDDQGNKLILEN